MTYNALFLAVGSSDKVAFNERNADYTELWTGQAH